MEKPVLWYQGLFLQPQHLQLNDRYTQDLLTPYNLHVAPYLWGAGNISFNKGDLARQVITVDNGEFWFKDKTYACVGQNARIEPRFFIGEDGGGGKPLTVYVGLKKYQETVSNVTSLPDDADLIQVSTRYISGVTPDVVADKFGKGAPAQVKCMDLLLKIFFEHEIDRTVNYELIPVAMLIKDGEEKVVCPDFIPPSFTVDGSARLKEQTFEILNQLLSRARELESYKKDRGVHNAEFGSRDMVYLLALRSVNRYVPVLDHLVKANVHPFHLYGVIRQVAGELSTFSENIDVMGVDEGGEVLLPIYDHSNLSDCFSRASSLISKLLDEITSGPKYVIPLVFDDTYFSASLDPTSFSGENRYFLAVKSRDNPDNILEAADISIKIGASEIMPVLLRQALPGVKLSYLALPPQELPRRADTYYFQLDHHGDIWGKIKDQNNISIHWDSAPQDLNMELMVIG